MTQAIQSAETDTDTPEADTETAIDATGLELTYSDGTEAVDGVDFDIESGECFGFLGPNGAGKTTTIRMLATLLEPTAGSLSVTGHDAVDQRRDVRAAIGYMAQETSIDGDLTARENLQFACEAYGVPRETRAARIEELLELADLADVSETPADRFSGGMQKRLDAAMALVHDPELVFLDEPTTGLDPKARNRLWEYFRSINDDGTTVFLTTQYLEEADQLCDRLAVIRDGEIVERGTPTALKRRVGGATLEIGVDGERVERAATVARERGPFEAEAVQAVDGGVRVTTPHTERGTDLLVALHEAGVAVTDFTVEEATLDDVFLAIADDSAADLEGAR